MNIKDKLQIIMVTYNRAKFVRKTLEQFFDKETPVKECEFIVQDNNSTDNTKEVVEEYIEKYPNIKYIKNRYNLGISGTIARAFERASKDYIWVIGDDDIFIFDCWHEVEDAINNNEKVISFSTSLAYGPNRNLISHKLFLLTFISGGIYSTSILNNTSIRNSLDNIYTLFPQSQPVIWHINNGGKIFITTKPIAINGVNLEEKDCSYTRGAISTNLSPRSQEMTWLLGWANTIKSLKDKDIMQEAFEAAINCKPLFSTIDEIWNYLSYLKNQKQSYFWEIYECLTEKRKQEFEKYLIKTNKKEKLSKLSNLSSLFNFYKITR